MIPGWCCQHRLSVALLAEGVDRNFVQIVLEPVELIVALLAEGVDRNRLAASAKQTCQVALLAEGVDRNTMQRMMKNVVNRRPPRRGRG